MAFTGRPSVTNTERQGMAKASGPKKLLLSAILTILKYKPEMLPEIDLNSISAPDPRYQQNMVKTMRSIPAPKPDTNFDKWQKKNRGL